MAIQPILSSTRAEWAVRFTEVWLEKSGTFQGELERGLRQALHVLEDPNVASTRRGKFTVAFSWSARLDTSRMYELLHEQIKELTRELTQASQILIEGYLGTQSPKASYVLEFCDEPYRLEVKYDIDFAAARSPEQVRISSKCNYLES